MLGLIAALEPSSNSLPVNVIILDIEVADPPGSPHPTAEPRV